MFLFARTKVATVLDIEEDLKINDKNHEYTFKRSDKNVSGVFQSLPYVYILYL